MIFTDVNITGPGNQAFIEENTCTIKYIKNKLLNLIISMKIWAVSTQFNWKINYT